MPNPIKYSLTSQSLALKTGNYYIGTGDVGKGPTSSTDYYNGITPPSGGYTIYLNKASGGPSIFTPTNDSELILITNKIAGTNYTTVIQCLNYFAGQNDKMCFNRDYEGIVTDGLVLNLDAGFIPSYPTNGDTWYDIGLDGCNGTLINGPTFDSDNGGSIVFDGVNDTVSTLNSIDITGNNPWSISVWVNVNSSEIGAGRKGWIIWKGLVGQELNQLISIGVASGYVEVAHWSNDATFFNSPIYFDNFQNISVTFDGSTEYIYINGINTDTKNTSLNVTSGVWYIASRAGVSDFLNCKIDSVSVYNRALSATEILQNYQATYPRFFGDNVVTSGLILHLDAGYAESYPGSGTTWKDISGNGNDVTLYNGISYQDGALVGDGVNDYGRTTNTLNLSGLTAITIVVICKVPTTTQKAIYEHTNNWNSIIVYDNVRYGGFGFFINSNGFNSLENSGHFQLNGNIGYSGSNVQLPTTSNYQQYTTIHDFSKSLNVSGYAEETTVYTNGSKSTQTASGGQNNTQTFVDDYLYLWSRGGSSFNSQASISQLLIYNRALTEAEITQNYNASKSRYGL